MADLLNAAIRIGPLTLLVGLAIAAVSFLLQLTRPDRGKILRRALRTAGIGVLGFGAGTVTGIALFCSSESGGNLCGLGGVFGLGPLAAGLCIGIHALVTHRPDRETK